MIIYQKVGTDLTLSGLLWNLNKTEFEAEIKKKKEHGFNIYIKM